MSVNFRPKGHTSVQIWPLADRLPDSERSAPAQKPISLQQPLHLLRRFNPQQSQCRDKLDFDEAAELQKKNLLRGVLFREHAVMVIKKIERLRQLKRELGDKRRLLRADR